MATRSLRKERIGTVSSNKMEKSVVVSEVKKLHQKWQDSLIFSRYPTDGIVVKVLDKSSVKILFMS